MDGESKQCKPELTYAVLRMASMTTVAKEVLGRGQRSPRPTELGQLTASKPARTNLLAGCLMSSGNCAVTRKKVHTNQPLANLRVLAGYLMGLSG